MTTGHDIDRIRK